MARVKNLFSGKRRLFDHLHRLFIGSVVNNDKFQVGPCLLSQGIDSLFDVWTIVVAWHHHTDQWLILLQPFLHHKSCKQPQYDFRLTSSFLLSF